ncbi:SusC/RagA family TonB-linked outer membrane protein [Psychroserpens algicola]|uniref:TonB-dependent receptor n=1 Tax=Psychroserpens algicola TaxID=1719034 RepID=A0ABT0H616_9FLAO|nr:TonB-dependent receptor [Psychroserpens algicola]MCK8479821.1 TonB-dependent receptor [Psychroserpens algicola]
MTTKIFSLIFLVFTSFAFSQEVDVRGTVTDQVSGEPLPGVNILVKGTSIGAYTDFDGNFEIKNIQVNSVLVFTYVGFKDQEVIVKNDEPLSVRLIQDSESLDEVVIIGYGSQRKELVTGAYSSIDAESIVETNPTRIEEALKGSAAGVQVNANSGSPGAALNIRIRGITTNGDNSPLVIVDGVNIGNDLSIIDPNDIEKMDIIKDASSAIYGVQGANGVILITTKSGKKNRKTKFSYNSYYTIQEADNQIDLLNNYEYAVYVNETEAADGNPIPYPNLQNIENNTDWQDELFERAPMFNHNLSITGGSETTSYGFSASYFAQDGVIASDKSNYKRWTIKNNLGVDVTEKLRLNTFLLYTNIRSKAIPEGGRGSALYYALNASPLTPVFDDSTPANISGGYAFIGQEQGNEIINPLALINNTYNEGYADRFTGKVELEYDIIDNLKATSRFNFNYSDFGGRSYFPLQYYGLGKVVNNVQLDANNPEVFDLDRNDDGIRDLYSTVAENSQHAFDYTWENFVDYSKTFNDKHNFNVLLGTSIRSEIYKGFFGSGPLNSGPDTWSNAYLGNTNSIIQVVDDEVTSSLVTAADGRNENRWYSFFGRIQYDYEGKYILSAMVRRDASTKFGPNNRVGNFPSISAGWLVSNEEFFDVNFINKLKVRGSWGITGNDKIGNFRWLGLLQGTSGEATYPFDDLLSFGNAVGALANPDLKWETNTQTNIGVDLGLFDNKLNLTVDYYKKTTEDLLLVPEVSGILGSTAGGSSAPFVNAGTIENKGIDLSINYSHDFNEDFNISVGYTLTSIKNKALKVNNAAGFIPGGLFGLNQTTSRFQTGLPIGVFYGLKMDGIYQNQAEIDALNTDTNNDGVIDGLDAPFQANASPGDIRYVDVDGDGVIEYGSSDDQTVIGNPIPDYTMGFNLNINYKSIDFGTSLYASIGNDIARSYERFLTYSNKPNFYLDRWTGEGTSNTVPRASNTASNNYLFSSFFVEDGSYLRIQNVQLGYSLPQAISEKLNLDKFRIYVAVNNLYTFTKYRGYNPDVSNASPLGAGVDLGQYPQTRTFTTGINVSF